MQETNSSLTSSNIPCWVVSQFYQEDCEEDGYPVIVWTASFWNG